MPRALATLLLCLLVVGIVAAAHGHSRRPSGSPGTSRTSVSGAEAAFYDVPPRADIRWPWHRKHPRVRPEHPPHRSSTRRSSARTSSQTDVYSAASLPRAGSRLTVLQKRIRSCESGPNGYATNGWAFDYDYRNQNPHSTASGAYQFLDGTWNGYKGYARAMDAPPAVQDEKFFQVFAEDGTTPWNASRSCWAG